LLDLIYKEFIKGLLYLEIVLMNPRMIKNLS